MFQSPDQRIREAAQRATYLEDLWKGLPYDSISLERGRTGGCLIACASSSVNLYRATVSGIVTAPLIARDGRLFAAGQLRGRAERHTVNAPDLTLVGVGNVQPPAPIIRDPEDRSTFIRFANLSYLLYTARFLQLPDEYACRSCGADRIRHVEGNGGKTKTVIDYGGGRPIELWAIQQAFDSVSKSITWTQK